MTETAAKEADVRDESEEVATEVVDADLHDDLPVEALAPAPSFWPIILALSLSLLPAGALFMIWGGPERFSLGLGLMIAGLGISLIPSMGWCHQVIRDKWTGHFGPEAQRNDLALGTKLFFISEVAIFGSLFGYYYVAYYVASSAGESWRPSHVTSHLTMPTVGLLILMASSVTCEAGHKALLRGRRGLCKSWMVITILLGSFFLTIQGYEWGFLLQSDVLRPESSIFGTLFYVMTGFHGLHVMTGVILLILVYGRLEIGHYSPTRHFSMNAASWYWHLVDVIWIFLFSSVYLL